jgi:GntR family transcriptional regulator
MASNTGVPAYVQVADDLRRQIESGALPPGGQLPSMAQLRELYNVSNTVIRDALNELRRADLTIGQQGKGVFVRDGQPGAPSVDEAIIQRLDELTATVRRLDERVARIEKSGAQSH